MVTSSSTSATNLCLKFTRIIFCATKSCLKNLVHLNTYISFSVWYHKSTIEKEGRTIRSELLEATNEHVTGPKIRKLTLDAVTKP